jgi:hypothetical protein
MNDQQPPDDDATADVDSSLKSFSLWASGAHARRRRRHTSAKDAWPSQGPSTSSSEPL